MYWVIVSLMAWGMMKLEHKMGRSERLEEL